VSKEGWSPICHEMKSGSMKESKGRVLCPELQQEGSRTLSLAGESDGVLEIFASKVTET
jgi:hypothetical protein